MTNATTVIYERAECFVRFCCPDYILTATG